MCVWFCIKAQNVDKKKVKIRSYVMCIKNVKNQKLYELAYTMGVPIVFGDEKPNRV